jgi:phosphoribosyl-AMP cyclohydrolase
MNSIPEDLAKRLASGELIPAIAQSAENNKVLMLAWMNKESLELTIKSGFATYWSRSRKEIWKKGETSGNLQKIEKIFFDCDSDSILLKVSQTGPACHTGEESCFHNELG